MHDIAVDLVALLMAAAVVGCILLWGVFVRRQIRANERALAPDDPADNLPWTFPASLRRRWSQFDTAQKQAWIRRSNFLSLVGFALFLPGIAAAMLGYTVIGLGLVAAAALVFLYMLLG